MFAKGALISQRPHLFKAEVDGETSSYEEREADASTREANAAGNSAQMLPLKHKTVTIIIAVIEKRNRDIFFS